MKGKKLLSAVIIILAAVVVCETVYLAAGSGGNGAYEPELSFVGDVEKAVSLRYEEGRYLLSVARTEEDGNGERDAEAAESGEAEQETESGNPEECAVHSFTFEGGKHRGVLLSDVMKQAGIVSDASHIYFAGYDGMMSSVDASSLGENYLVFGANGWEVMNEGYPASSNVKAMEYVVTVANDPAEVPAAVNVTDDSGHERVISPGTLFLENSVSSRRFHGQSEKGGQSVVVFTTDTWVQIGQERLQLDKNRIVRMSDGE